MHVRDAETRRELPVYGSGRSKPLRGEGPIGGATVNCVLYFQARTKVLDGGNVSLQFFSARGGGVGGVCRVGVIEMLHKRNIIYSAM